MYRLRAKATGKPTTAPASGIAVATAEKDSEAGDGGTISRSAAAAAGDHELNRTDRPDVHVIIRKSSRYGWLGSLGCCLAGTTATVAGFYFSGTAAATIAQALGYTDWKTVTFLLTGNGALFAMFKVSQKIEEKLKAAQADIAAGQKEFNQELVCTGGSMVAAALVNKLQGSAALNASTQLTNLEGNFFYDMLTSKGGCYFDVSKLGLTVDSGIATISICNIVNTSIKVTDACTMLIDEAGFDPKQILQIMGAVYSGKKYK